MIILDIIEQSMDKPYIKMSDRVFEALNKLIKFNTQNIYMKSLTDEEYKYYEEGMNKLFYTYLEDLKNRNEDSIIYKIFLNTQSDNYLESTPLKRQVIDFIGGMTDEFFLQEIRKYKN